MSELKKCPFCGKEPSINHEKSYFGSVVRCTNLSCDAFNYEILYEDWQSRPIESALLSRAEKAEAKVKELREELDKDNSYFEDIYTALEMEDFAPSCIPEINKLKGRNFELEQSVIELESSLAALKEATRWRSYPGEVPEDDQVVLAKCKPYPESGTVIVRVCDYIRMDSFSGFYNTDTDRWEDVIAWRSIDLSEIDKEGKE